MRIVGFMKFVIIILSAEGVVFKVASSLSKFILLAQKGFLQSRIFNVFIKKRHSLIPHDNRMI